MSETVKPFAPVVEDEAELLQRYDRDSRKAEELARESPGSHVWVNGIHAHVPPPTIWEEMFGFKL